MGLEPGIRTTGPGMFLPHKRLNNNLIQCFWWAGLGHIAANCPLTTEPMQCDTAYINCRVSFCSQPACTNERQAKSDKANG